MISEKNEAQREENSVYSTYARVLEAVSKNTDDYLIILDPSSGVTKFYGDISSRFDFPEDGIINNVEQYISIVHPLDRKRVTESLRAIVRGEKDQHDIVYRWVDRDGGVTWISCRAHAVNSPDGERFIVGRVSEEALKHLYNPLTGLWNTVKLNEDLVDHLKANRGYFLLLDIDDLSGINFRYGRKHGDNLLKTIGSRLFSYPDILRSYHIDNKNFGAVVMDSDPLAVRRIFERISGEMRTECTFTAAAVPISSNMFVDPGTLVSAVKLTLKKAKARSGDRLEFFSGDDIAGHVRKYELFDEMRQSVLNGFTGFSLNFQPQLRSGSYELCSVEALLRFNSKLHGAISPMEFIPILESGHLIGEVGMWVLQEALKQCKLWRRYIPNLSVSVNFSLDQFNDVFLADRVIRTLNSVGLVGSALTVELTESMAVEKGATLFNNIKGLRSAGVRISIDDFGAGYSNIAYLNKYDVDEVKIDRAIIRDIEEDTYNYNLVSSIISFAKGSGIKVLCEGVEGMRELTLLERIGPHAYQGFLFDRPLTAEALENAYINRVHPKYKERTEFISRLYVAKEKIGLIHFVPGEILRENEIGLWVIRLNPDTAYYEMHADSVMEDLLDVDSKQTPEDLYWHWHDRIREDYVEYVHHRVWRMRQSGGCVQLEYPWMHPILGEVTVRCSGRRTADSDGMIVLQGYHRIISNVEGV